MAQAYGFFPSRIARSYAFKPPLIPSLTIIGLDFAAMLGNAFLVEAVFASPRITGVGLPEVPEVSDEFLAPRFSHEVLR